MIIHIEKRGKFYYVENDDCYIFYYLFYSKINNKRCYFRKKYLDKVMFTLASKELSFQVSDVCM